MTPMHDYFFLQWASTGAVMMTPDFGWPSKFHTLAAGTLFFTLKWAELQVIGPKWPTCLIRIEIEEKTAHCLVAKKELEVKLWSVAHYVITMTSKLQFLHISKCNFVHWWWLNGWRVDIKKWQNRTKSSFQGVPQQESSQDELLNQYGCFWGALGWRLLVLGLGNAATRYKHGTHCLRGCCSPYPLFQINYKSTSPMVESSTHS